MKFIPLLAMFFAACAGSRSEPPAGGARGAPPLAASSSATVGELLAGVEAAYRAGRYDEGLALVKRTLELGHKDLSVIDRVGSIYHLLGRYGEAITMWEQGLRLEKDPKRRAELERSITVAKRSLGLPEEERSVETAPPPRPAGARPAKRPKDPKAIEKLYDEGVAYYARGEYLQATALFMRVLELDPEHALARKALARLRLKPSSGAPHGNPG